MSPKRDDFIKRYRSAAEAIEKEVGIPAPRILAQAGHETGWNVDAPGFNFFGIKAQPGYQGSSQTLDTTEDFGNGLQKVKQRFRSYEKPEDSFRDWANLIQTKRYQGAMAPGLSDADYAQALKDGGYATDANYAPKLAKVIADTRTAMGMPADTTVATATPSAPIPGAMMQSAEVERAPMQAAQVAQTQTQTPAAGVPAAKAVADGGPFSLGGSTRNGLSMMAMSGTPQQAPSQPIEAPIHRPNMQGVPSLIDLIFPRKNPYSLFG